MDNNATQTNRNQQIIETLKQIIQASSIIIKNPNTFQLLIKENISPNLYNLNTNLNYKKNEELKNVIISHSKFIINLLDLSMLLLKKINIMNKINSLDDIHPDQNYEFYSCVDEVNEKIEVFNVKKHSNIEEIDQNCDTLKFRIIEQDSKYLKFFQALEQTTEQQTQIS